MTKPIRNTDVVLVIVDISGYTRFVQQRAVSLEHAEAIVTELIESIIDQASNPLVVNKLEGDAALLYAETLGDRRAAVTSVIGQLAQFFNAFAGSLQRIKAARSHCSCDACANIGALQLKAFVHVGEIVVKQVRQFEEIAGEAVIMVHRMTKNSLPLHEYVLMTDAVYAEGGDAIRNLMQQTETIDGVQALLHWCDVAALMQCPAVVGALAAGESVAARSENVASASTESARPIAAAGVQRVAVFNNLPAADAPAAPAGWWSRLLGRLPGRGRRTD